MKKLYLIDPRNEIVQIFPTASDLYRFCSRLTRGVKGKTLVVQDGERARVYNLTDEAPAEVNQIAMRLQYEVSRELADLEDTSANDPVAICNQGHLPIDKQRF
jgi:hypothetical protein